MILNQPPVSSGGRSPTVSTLTYPDFSFHLYYCLIKRFAYITHSIYCTGCFLVILMTEERLIGTHIANILHHRHLVYVPAVSNLHPPPKLNLPRYSGAAV